MVQTRSQARAQAAAQASASHAPNDQDEPSALADMEEEYKVEHDVIIEHDAVSPSSVEEVGTIEEKMQRIVEHFWARTQAIATEHAILMNQQQQQSQLHEAAIHAVHADARSGVKEVAANQQIIALQIQQAIAETQASMQQELHELARVQTEQSRGICESFEEHLNQVVNQIEEKVAIAQVRITNQDNDSRLMEERVMSAIRSAHEDLERRINSSSSHLSPSSFDEAIRVAASSVEERVGADLRTIASNLIEENLRSASWDQRTAEVVEAKFTESAVQMDEHIEARMKQALEAAKQAATRIASQREEARIQDIMKHVDETSQEHECRIEQKMREALRDSQAEIQLEVQRQSEKTSQLDSRVAILEERMVRMFGEDRQRLDLIESNQKDPTLSRAAATSFTIGNHGNTHASSNWTQLDTMQTREGNTQTPGCDDISSAIQQVAIEATQRIKHAALQHASLCDNILISVEELISQQIDRESKECSIRKERFKRGSKTKRNTLDHVRRKAQQDVALRAQSAARMHELCHLLKRATNRDENQYAQF